MRKKKLTVYQKEILHRLREGEAARLVYTTHPFPAYVRLEFMDGEFKETVRKDAMPLLLPYLDLEGEAVHGKWIYRTYRVKP